MLPMPIRVASLIFACLGATIAMTDNACAQSLAPAALVAAQPSLDAMLPSFQAPAAAAPVVRPPLALASSEDVAIQQAMDAIVDRAIYKTPRKRVADFAMSLRGIRYQRAGRDPSTGFDCSGFTHYVYNKTFGLELPYDAPSQFREGEKVAREDLRIGDLVFFQEHHRITHVGMYIGEGRFIDSPKPGKHVRIDHLTNAYWAKRYAGARRMPVLAS